MAKQSKFSKNDLFQVVIDYLFREKLVKGKGNLANRIGITPSTLSHILSHEQEVSDETLYKLNEAFGHIFNMEYFRGRSTYYLLEDVSSAQKEKDNKESGSGYPTISSVFNAGLAQQAENVEGFRKALEKADEIIKEKNERILELKDALSEKDARIDTLKELVAQLRADLNEAKAIIASYDSGQSKWPFNMGAAERGENIKQRK